VSSKAGELAASGHTSPVTASELKLAATFCTSKASTLVPVKQEYRNNGSVRPHVASDSKRGESSNKTAEDPRSEVQVCYATCCVCARARVCVHAAPSASVFALLY
jgi:hypothetical protein